MSGAAIPSESERNHELALDDICFLLSTARRQHVVAVIADERVITRRDLYSRVAKIEREQRTNAKRRRVRNSVRTNLVQKHLPQLDKHGVIVDNGTTVREGPNFDVVVDAMRTLKEVAR